MTDDEPRYAVRPRRPEDADVAAARFRLRAEVDDPEARCHVALDEKGEIVGLATAGATRDPDSPTEWELYSINVLATAQGSGVADQLIRAAIGERDASLWVVATNARAQAFYRRHGFVPDGATRVHEDTGAGEIRMVRLGGPRTP